MANEEIPPKEDEVEEVEEIVEQKDDAGNDTTDWKALALKQAGMAKRFNTRLKKLADETKKPKPEVKADAPVAKKEGILNALDRAVLRVEKITEPEEIELVELRMKETGRDLEALLAASWFKSELQELREKATSFVNMPVGSKRSNQVARDSVEYWIAKGELPPKGQRQLRIDVVNAKMKREQNKSIFAQQDVV